jgi:hypothetical protein
MLAIRNIALFISLLMIVSVTIFGLGMFFQSNFKEGVTSSFPFIAVDIYYFLLLFYWRKYDDVVIYRKANTIIFICGLFPLIFLVVILFLMSTIEC